MKKIVRVSNDSEYFVIISDEATDVSTHACKVSECTGGKVISRGEFLGFMRETETTGEYLAELF